MFGWTEITISDALNTILITGSEMIRAAGAQPKKHLLDGLNLFPNITTLQISDLPLTQEGDYQVVHQSQTHVENHTRTGGVGLVAIDLLGI